MNQNKLCNNCGKTLNENDKVCMYCGQAVNKLNTIVDVKKMDEKEKRANIKIARFISGFAFLVSLISVMLAASDDILAYVFLITGVITAIASFSVFVGSFFIDKNKSPAEVEQIAETIVKIAGFILLFSIIDLIVIISEILFGIDIDFDSYINIIKLFEKFK